jgi:lipopolysaccharide/colanic/teichoic acid biosynthesis glycosyltransferase
MFFTKTVINISRPLYRDKKRAIADAKPFIVDSLFVRKLPLWKRTMDIVGALSGIILLSPLFLVIGIVI